MEKIGVLLNNIGTPTNHDPVSVKEYLNQFLMDPDVISIPRPFRDILVKGIIVPLRGEKSAAKYKSIWTDEGSPLMVFSQRFAHRLQANLGERFHTEIGMRYGQPSIEAALKSFAKRGIRKIILVPLFPQFAEATTGSVTKYAKAAVAELGSSEETRFSMSVLDPFFSEKSFFESFAALIRRGVDLDAVDHLVFSYHSLPESQIRRQTGCLISGDCCIGGGACEKPCYRAQCFKTTELIASVLKLPKSKYTSSFQSRLGPTKWIGPSTWDIVIQLASTGKSKIAIVCPSFVADCLETLEEIGLEVRKAFLANGGHEMHLIPCLNDVDDWAKGFSETLSEYSRKLN